jgi:predicted GTPase
MVLPAMGYGEQQIAELTETINRSDCDLVVSGTPIDLSRLIKANKKILRVQYDIEEIGSPDLAEILKDF